MDERIKYRLNSASSQEDVNVDGHLKANIESKQKLLPVGDINRILNVAERFDYERQTSTCYRLVGTMNPIFSNVLFNTTGVDSLAYFMTNTLFRDRTYPANGVDFQEEEDMTYREAITYHLQEIDGWYGYIDPDFGQAALCLYHDMEPKREYFDFTPKNKIKNWELTVTYPALSADTYMTQGGLLVIDADAVDVSNRPMTMLATPTKHNLQQGDTVRVTGFLDSSHDGDYPVIRTGMDDGSLRDYYFVIDLDGGSITNNTRMARMFAGEPSIYYFRKFKKVATVNNAEIEDDDYEIYPLNFSSNLFNDGNSQFVINEDIDVANLTDNLGRPLTEMYITIVKTDGDQGIEKGPLFTPIQSGIEMPFIPNTNSFPTSVPDIRRIHNGTTPTPHNALDTNVMVSDTEFYGDVVEYNRYQVKETVLAEVRHRFNTINREQGGFAIDPSGVETSVDMGQRFEGYFYKPHHQIKIRDLSSYIEQGDSSTGGIPDYAENLGDGRWLWRDILDIGTTDLNLNPVNYPFLNGCHYIHQNYCFPLRRQDPFALYGLYYSDFPRDPFGDRMTDNFVVNKKENAC